MLSVRQELISLILFRIRRVNAVQSVERQRKFGNNLSHSLSGSKNEPTKPSWSKLCCKLDSCRLILSHVASIFRTREQVKQDARLSWSQEQNFLPSSRWALFSLFFNPEDKGDIFLRNMDWYSTGVTVSYPRRQISWNSRLLRSPTAVFCRLISCLRDWNGEC
jgi:hypothetical protein